MLAQLCLFLKADAEEITYRKASRLQGVLMEHISTEYAAKLHEQSVHPYSQSLILNRDGTAVWRIGTLNEEAYQQMMAPLLSEKFTSFQFNTGMQVQIQDKKITRMAEEDLLNNAGAFAGKAAFSLTFLTPAAFRQHGSYTLFPEPFLLYQSVLNRIQAVSDLKISVDEAFLEQLSQGTLVKRYSLRTMTFPEEGVHIPGFTGNAAYEVHGSPDEVSLALYLMQFGACSGIGVKTGMGMGSMQFYAEKEKARRRRD